MKDIRLKYHRNTGIRVQPEMNLIEDYTHYDEDKCYHTQPFPNLYDYINWLEDQLENPIGVKGINTAKAAEALRIALMKL